MQYRKLQDDDLHALDAFLAAHADTSMVLRGNLRKAGMNRRHSAFSGMYCAAFGPVRDGRSPADTPGDAPEGAAGGASGGDWAICAVVAIYGNGSVVVQTGGIPVPLGLVELVRAELAQMAKPLAGIFGPADQAAELIDLLGLSGARFAINARDALYTLDLAEIRIPANLRADHFQMVDADRIDRGILLNWLRAYEIEALGAEDNQALDGRVAGRLVHALDERVMWVLVVDGVPVSLSGFNAQLPDMVQIGPVWTPPEYRNRGYARILVAKTLLAARARMVTRAILSTDSPAAARAYEALGFTPAGYYRLAILG